MTPNAETVHRLFRGASEIAKRLRLLALMLDLIAAAIAALGIWGYIATRSGWTPLVILGLSFIAIAIRVLASSCRSFGLRCRRAALRAFATATDIQPVSKLDLEEAAPPFAEYIASWLPAQTLEEYYEPTRPVGNDRLCELYAHSAFYTCRLLKRYAWICGITGLLVFVGGMVILYSLAMEHAVSATVRESVVATICSFVYVLIFARILQLTICCVRATVSIRRLEDDFFDKPSADRLRELMEGYEIERATGPDVPTPLYYLGRDKLQRKWHEKRLAL